MCTLYENVENLIFMKCIGVFIKSYKFMNFILRYFNPKYNSVNNNAGIFDWDIRPLLHHLSLKVGAKQCGIIPT
jgi:hypothetical protein